MANRPFPGSLLLADELSPLPVVGGFGRLLLSGEDPDQNVKLSDVRATYNTAGEAELKGDTTLVTRQSAVALSYAREFDRVLAYACALADDVQVVTSTVPRLDRSGVTVNAVAPGAGSRPPRAGSRLRRLLTEAVRTSGGEHRLSQVVDLDHWLEVADSYFSPLGRGSSTRLAVSPAFLPVLTEWLRGQALAAATSRRMIRADLGLPADPTAFQKEAARLENQVAAVAAALGRAFVAPGLAAYRAGARVVLDLQAEFRRGPDRVGLQPLFMEAGAGEPFIVPAIGLDIPPPSAGYPLELADGSIEQVPVPPWQLGRIYDEWMEGNDD